MDIKPPRTSGSLSDNNPQAAASARAKIAGLPNQYRTANMPAKSQLAGAAAGPTSPAADALPIVSYLPAINAKPKLPSKFGPLAAAVATFLLLFLVFKSPILLSQLGYFTEKPETGPAQNTVAVLETVAPEPLINIPKINVSVPVVYPEVNDEASIQKALQSGVVHYAGTAKPGQRGNTVIVGHSSNDWWEPGDYKFAFVLLDKLVPGDTMTVNYNSKRYLYEVTESKVVEPTEVSVLAQTEEPILTLITCTPPGTSWKRLIVRAKQVSPVIESSQAANTNKPDGTPMLPSNAPGLSQQIAKLWNSLAGLLGNKPPETAPGSLPGID
ncbi:MAG TPA: class D sortase [Candidatus Dormibacteraeota bacterium]|nr:class D sortase [Candidatus Dormibacteraeota bacterium]